MNRHENEIIALTFSSQRETILNISIKLNKNRKIGKEMEFKMEFNKTTRKHL